MHQEMLHTRFATLSLLENHHSNPLRPPQLTPLPHPPASAPLKRPFFHHTSYPCSHPFTPLPQCKIPCLTTSGARQRLRSHLRRWYAPDIVGDIDFPTLELALLYLFPQWA